MDGAVGKDYEVARVVCDPRGFVLEPVGAADLPGQRNAHVVLTRPNEVRGNHYHRKGRELITVVGPALVRLRRAGAIRDVRVPENEAYRFRFEPGESHAIVHTGERDGVLVAFNTEPHDPSQPDTVRDALL
jgi:dTDP-4-dehydrorhamnose 3,5-epimerase-like enzyme